MSKQEVTSILISYIVIMAMLIGTVIPLALGASLYVAAGMGIVVTIIVPITAFTVYSICMMEVPYD